MSSDNNIACFFVFVYFTPQIYEKYRYVILFQYVILYRTHVNLILVLGAQEEYGEMIELYQKRIGQISEKAYLAKAETYSSLALLYGKTGDSLSYFKMTHYASNEFEKCFSQKPITVDLVGSFLVFVAYRDGKDSALIELKKYRDVFPDEDFYSVFENQLMEFNPDNDFNSRCH